MIKCKLLLALLFTSIVLRVDAADINYFSGLYLGSGIGLNSAQASHGLQFDADKVADVSRYNAHFKSTAQSGFASLMLGYQKSLYDLLWVGLELGLQLAPSLETRHAELALSYRNRRSFDGRMHLGLRHNKWQLYGLTGLGLSQSKQSLSFPVGGIYQSTMMFLDGSIKTSTLFIKTFGAGLERAVSQHLAIRLEYAHQFLPVHSFGALNHSSITYNNPKGYALSSLSCNQVILGVLYRVD